MKLRVRKLTVAAALLFTAIPAALAGDDAVALGIGTASRLSLAKAFQTVIVGDPHVVDVRVDDDRSVLIEPLGPGQTNLVFVDAHGMVIANVKISVCGMPPSKACMVGQAL
jgi:Flp pilus assembly secretin CpaC